MVISSSNSSVPWQKYWSQDLWENGSDLRAVNCYEISLSFFCPCMTSRFWLLQNVVVLSVYWAAFGMWEKEEDACKAVMDLCLNLFLIIKYCNRIKTVSFIVWLPDRLMLSDLRNVCNCTARNWGLRYYEL